VPTIEKMNRFFSLLLIGFGWVLVSAQTPAKVVPAEQAKPSLPRLTQALQAKLDQSRTRAKFPGAQVGFVFVEGQSPDGAARYRSGSVATGFADLQTNTSLKTSDRLLAGSIGKTFVAALTMLLVQDGKLNLDEKIERWLGNETWFAKLPNAKDITLRMLLNHSSGIPNHVDEPRFLKAVLKGGNQDIKYEELVGFVLNKKPLFAAGRGYSYADTNYILVGLIVEKVTGKKLYEQIIDRILKPNGLDRTIPSDAITLPEVANGYLDGKPVIVKGKFTINPQWEWAGGGFASTAEDLARWATLLYGGRILSETSLEQMMSSTTVGEGADYGLGVMTTPSKWGKSIGHDGEFPGYLSDMRYYPKYQLAVVFMVNFDQTKELNSLLSSAVDDFAGVIIGEISPHRLSTENQAKLQQLTEHWLNLIDTGKYPESWERLTAKLKANHPQQTWRATLHPVREKVGNFKSRKLKGISYSDPQTETVVVDFETSFSKFANASERVVLELENGDWHVASYSIHYDH